MSNEEIDYQEMGQKMYGMPLPTWAQYYQLDSRLKILESRAEGFDRRLELGAERFSDIERKNDKHCEEIRQLRTTVEAHNQHVTEMKQLLEDIKSMLQVFESARGTVTVLGAMGGFLKWVTGIGAAVVILWVWLKTGIRS